MTQTYAQTTLLSLKPSEITVDPGQEFTIDINITNVVNMYAYELKIYYKNSILNATKAVRPPGHFMEPSDPANQFIPKWEIKNNYNATHGRIWLGFTLLAPEAPKSGSGILARITFKAIGSGTTPLNLKDTKLADSSGNPIPHTPEDCVVTVKQPKLPTVSINPPEVTIEVGQQFTVDLNITDVTNLYGYEIMIWYLNSIVNATKAVRPPGHFMEPSDPANQFVAKWEIKNNFNATHGRIWLGFTLLAPEPAKSGSGILARITFVGLSEGSTPIILNNYPGAQGPVKLADNTGAPIPHTAQDGLVTVKLPVLTPPTIEVSPKLVSPKHRYEIIVVNVTIKDLDCRWKAVGFEFKLGYNGEQIQVVNVAEGPFLKQFGETYVTPPVIKPNYVHLGLLLIPQVDGTWTQYPNGSGTLATIFFNVTKGPPATSTLELYDTKIADITATPPGVPHNAVSGEYNFATEVLSPIIVWKDPTTNQTQTFQVQTESNSTIDDITFSQKHRYISFTATGPEGSVGYCNITIPKTLLDAEPEEWLILVDGKTMDYMATANATHTFIYFTYSLSTRTIYIFATRVVPELSTYAILLALFTTTLIITLSKKKLTYKKPKNK